MYLYLPHVRAQTHLQFFSSYSNQIHSPQKILQTIIIWSYF